MSNKHIILIGFMGAGKSSVARRVARWEQLPCVDSDSCIEQQQGLSIAELFDQRGEAGFRALETAFLRSLGNQPRMVLSCGGGVITVAENRALLAQLCTVVYLRVSPEQVLQRLGNQSGRPLLSGTADPAELLRERAAYYEDAADFSVQTDGRDINQVAREIIRRLKSRGEL